MDLVIMTTYLTLVDIATLNHSAIPFLASRYIQR